MALLAGGTHGKEGLLAEIRGSRNWCCGLTQVQALIGAKHAMAFDLTAACSGFVVGLITAAQFIRTGRYRNIVIIGADALSRYVDWRDRGKYSPIPSLCLICIMCEDCAHRQ